MTNLEESARRSSDGSATYREVRRTDSMSWGVYVVPAGATDQQRPHREDELYYIVRGRGRFRHGQDERTVAAGELLYVAAGEPHRFTNVEEELVLLVVFAPPESGSEGAPK